MTFRPAPVVVPPPILATDFYMAVPRTIGVDAGPLEVFTIPGGDALPAAWNPLTCSYLGLDPASSNQIPFLCVSANVI